MWSFSHPLPAPKAKEQLEQKSRVRPSKPQLQYVKELERRVAELSKHCELLESKLHSERQWQEMKARARASESELAKQRERADLACVKCSELEEAAKLREYESHCLSEELVRLRFECSELRRKCSYIKKHDDNSHADIQHVINKTLQEGHNEEKAASNKQVVWNLCSWLKRIDVTPILEEAILHQLHKFSSDPHLELIFMRHLAALGKSDESASQAALAELFFKSGIVERLSEELAAAAQALLNEKKSSVSTPSPTRQPRDFNETTPLTQLERGGAFSKFADEASGMHDYSDARFTLSFGGIEDFFGGLEKLVGEGQSHRLEGMRADHCNQPDSTLNFTAGNYGTTTRSEIEWFFCTEPTEQSLQALGIIEWPREEKLIAGCQSHLCRKPLPLSTFSRQLALANEKLTVFHSHVGEDEFLAGRLYTGPMFVKYNAILRGIVSPISFFQEEYHRLCLGNTYATTLHTINSALAKLSLLTMKTTVYRGMAGGALPEKFKTFDSCGIKGGVEMGFMSTTLNKEVAFEYAKGGAGIVFEIEQGAVDRGANLSWLSQYQHEAEITFPPLCMLELTDLSFQGSVCVARLRPRTVLGSVGGGAQDMVLDVFHNLDDHATSTIERGQFMQALKELQRTKFLPNINDEQAESIFDVLDHAGSGSIRVREFQDAIDFYRFSLTQGVETLSHSTLKTIMTSIGSKGILKEAHSEMIDFVLRIADLDDDGRLNMAEYVRIQKVLQAVLVSDDYLDKGTFTKEIDEMRQRFGAERLSDKDCSVLFWQLDELWRRAQREIEGGVNSSSNRRVSRLYASARRSALQQAIELVDFERGAIDEMRKKYEFPAPSQLHPQPPTFGWQYSCSAPSRDRSSISFERLARRPY